MPMNLKSIKLVGFKSFVDPTVIPVTARLTGVVGPNGCGKSNIVDAIRWVIGETSAKQLRGQAMTDVIFNGTAGRKPVGMAAVELIFDNSDGRIGGEYARYSEISIRREVHREGQSQYFLNGVHCRRRDIIDVFLGTGLGARSYAIIEQGVISELVEAKPEELRTHLEEVAGISKYKERRRETEMRMRHTQENLDRLNDVNEELCKQLRHLKRQAEAAERYTALKQQERRLQAELKVLQWQTLGRQSAEQETQLTDSQLQQDALLAQLRAVETEVEKIREKHAQASAERDAVQKQFYSAGAQIARLEQQISHCQEQLQHWRKELTDIEAQSQELATHTEEQQQHIAQLSADFAELTPQAVTAKTSAQTAGEAWQAMEQQMRQWQQSWDVFQKETAQLSAETRVLKTDIQHYEQQFASLEIRHRQLLERREQLPLETLTAEIAPLTEQSAVQRKELEELQAGLTQISEAIRVLRQENSDRQHSLDHCRREWQQLQSQQAALAAVQQTALGYHDDHTKEWLSQWQIADRPRLGQALQVNSGWELAVETVLGGYFDAVCLERVDEFIESMAQISQGCCTLIGCGISSDAMEDRQRGQAPLLSAQIQSQWPLQNWLSGIYTADNWQEAQQMRERLTNEESVITRDGVWLSKHWVRINKAVTKDSGVLVREQALKQLARQIDEAHATVLAEQEQLERGQAQWRQLEEQRDARHQEYQTVSAKLTEAQSQLSARQSRFSELQQQQQRLAKEVVECEQSLHNLQELLTKHREKYQQTVAVEQSQAQERVHRLQERDRLQHCLDEVRRKADQERRAADECLVRLTATENQLALLKQNSLRDERRCQQLEERREWLTTQLAEHAEPLTAWRTELQQQLADRLSIEKTLHAAQEALTASQQQLEQLTKTQQEAQKQLSALKTQWQTWQVEHQAVVVRQATIIEQLVEQQWVLEELLAALSPSAETPLWENQLADVMARIQRLGPINLAAIDEYQTVSERKIYLDKQQADLNEALDILKAAIQKIDRETQIQFQETFTQVNQNFQQLFPRIFGGGKAMLELLEEDWLTAGILVKAQPPGKRNATIHLLSGGEKALTAVALVFAMFQLNPAPFCVLDEVDAPLDDMNTGRFCQLVKEMAKTTQFIMISHNKVTISLAERLMGVTMQEAGVSRIVSVDVAEAVALAEA
jgi:chromosome segregation protein